MESQYVRTALFGNKYPGGVLVISDLQQHPGNIFFVDSGHASASDAAGYGLTPDRPFATLDYAVGNCTASNGDVIYLMPGHAESITGATSVVMDVAGVKVVGLGWGSTRPTFTLTTATAATWNVTAANCWIENVLIVGNFLNIAAMMTVGADADGLTLKNVEMRNTSVILGALVGIAIATGVTDVTIDGFKFVEVTGGLTAAGTSVIAAAGTHDRFKLINSDIRAHCSAAAVKLDAGIGYNLTLERIRLLQTDTGAGLGIACHNTSTGLVEDVVSINLKNGVKGVTGTGLSIGQNVVYSNAVNAYAGLFSYTIDS